MKGVNSMKCVEEVYGSVTIIKIIGSPVEDLSFIKTYLETYGFAAKIFYTDVLIYTVSNNHREEFIQLYKTFQRNDSDAEMACLILKKKIMDHMSAHYKNLCDNVEAISDEIRCASGGVRKSLEKRKEYMSGQQYILSKYMNDILNI